MRRALALLALLAATTPSCARTAEPEGQVLLYVTTDAPVGGPEGLFDRLAIDGYSTKKMREVLKTLGLDGRSTLVVIDQANPTVEGSARNLPGVSVIRAEGLNVYDVLRHQVMLITRPALDALEARLGGKASAEGSAR